jgi:predicted patatin/cPLA2 family phospholipase
VAHPVVELIRTRAAAGSRPGERTDGARLALAIEGGGMRGAITGGMCGALDRLSLLDVFDDVYGASSGALNAAWFVSGAALRTMDAWADRALRTASVRRRNLLRGRPIVDGRHLTEVVYERLTPLPFDAILASRIGLHPLATDTRTGASVDLAPSIVDRASLKLSLRASTALPLLSGRPVELGGRRFFDAGIAESIPFVTPIAQGATHLMVLRSRRAGDQDTREIGRSASLVARYLSRHSPALAAAFLARPSRLLATDAELAACEAATGSAPAVVSVRPGPEMAPIGRLERDDALILAGLRAGERAVHDLLDGPLGHGSGRSD